MRESAGKAEGPHRPNLSTVRFCDCCVTALQFSLQCDSIRGYNALQSPPSLVLPLLLPHSGRSSVHYFSPGTSAGQGAGRYGHNQIHPHPGGTDRQSSWYIDGAREGSTSSLDVFYQPCLPWQDHCRWCHPPPGGVVERAEQLLGGAGGGSPDIGGACLECRNPSYYQIRSAQLSILAQADEHLRLSRCETGCKAGLAKVEQRTVWGAQK